MSELESYSPGQKLAGWIGVAVSLAMLAICLDVATGGRLGRGRAGTVWGQATSEEATADD
jgi:hypothetical protein